MKHDHNQFSFLKERIAERIPADAVALIEREGRPKLEVRLCNISVAGFHCRSPEKLDIGSEVVLQIPGVGKFSATVAWQLGPETGAQFHTPLSWKTIFAALLKSITPRSGARPRTAG